MNTYRTGNNWGVTIVREGRGEPNASNCGLIDDELVAVVVNGDRALAERICALLNVGSALDRTYLRGASDALADVRRQLAAYSGPHVRRGTIDAMLTDAAAELGVDEKAPEAAPRSTETAREGAAGGSGGTEAAETISGHVAERRASLFRQPHSWTPNCGEACNHEGPVT